MLSLMGVTCVCLNWEYSRDGGISRDYVWYLTCSYDLAVGKETEAISKIDRGLARLEHQHVVGSQDPPAPISMPCNVQLKMRSTIRTELDATVPGRFLSLWGACHSLCQVVGGTGSGQTPDSNVCRQFNRTHLVFDTHLQ